MALVWCSGQNIDRLVTVMQACIKTGRQFILDMYTAHVLRATGNERLPQAGWEHIKCSCRTLNDGKSSGELNSTSPTATALGASFLSSLPRRLRPQ
jgi:hypothetical protein